MIWFFVLTLTFADGSLDQAHSYMFPTRERCESTRLAMAKAINDGEEKKELDLSKTCSKLAE